MNIKFMILYIDCYLVTFFIEEQAKNRNGITMTTG